MIRRLIIANRAANRTFSAVLHTASPRKLEGNLSAAISYHESGHPDRMPLLMPSERRFLFDLTRILFIAGCFAVAGYFAIVALS